LGIVTVWHYLSQQGGIRGMAGVAGLEPVTSAVTGQRSNQLSYTPRSEPQKLLDTSMRVNHQSTFSCS
jgi:hypothetical protein